MISRFCFFKCSLFTSVREDTKPRLSSSVSIRPTDNVNLVVRSTLDVLWQVCVRGSVGTKEWGVNSTQDVRKSFTRKAAHSAESCFPSWELSSPMTICNLWVKGSFTKNSIMTRKILKYLEQNDTGFWVHQKTHFLGVVRGWCLLNADS